VHLVYIKSSPGKCVEREDHWSDTHTHIHT